MGAQAHRVELRAEPRALTRAAAVGTSPSNDLILTDPSVSRRHLSLERHTSGVMVTDGGSTNGTFLRGVAIGKAIVPAGTSLEIGSTTVRIDDGEVMTLPVHQGH